TFLPQVTGTPTEDELKKLFDKYKSQEARPDSDQPGFREPRRIQVEWVAASPEAPFYQKAADQLLALLPSLRLLGDTTAAAQLVAPLTLDAEVLNAEKTVRAQEQPWTTSFPQSHESSYL